MTCGYCRDCRHWQDVGRYCGIGVPESYREWGRCALAGTGDGDPINPDTKAQAQDAENYAAWLATAPDFGCVQFAAKEEA